MAKKSMGENRSINDRKNPNQGFENPFFRNDESEFVGEEHTVLSPVGSVFNEGYLRSDGSNAAEDTIHDQLSGPSRRQNSYSKTGK